MKLSKWQKLAGYSNKQIAKLLGTTTSYITYLKQEKRIPSGAIAKKIVEMSEGAVTYEDLFEPDPTTDPTNPA